MANPAGAFHLDSKGEEPEEEPEEEPGEEPEEKPEEEPKEEPVGDDPNGLTLYDLHRKPRTIKIDPCQRKRIPVKLLHPDFRCPICMGYMKKTSLVMECMHRFCEECITASIRKGKNECPTCRNPIPSRRSLRHDKRFDSLIQSILGDAQKQDDLELEQNELMNQAKQRSNVQRNEKKRAASSTERKRAREEPLLPTAPIQDFVPSPLVEFLLVRHAEETTLQSLLRNRIKVSGEAPVATLQCFLSEKFACGPSKDIQIMIRIANESFVELNPVLKLGQVQDKFCYLDETMVLYYRLKSVV